MLRFVSCTIYDPGVQVTLCIPHQTPSQIERCLIQRRKNKMSRILGLTLLAAMALAAPARAETVTFKATMSGAQEVPPKTTDGKGDAQATLDTTTKVLTYKVTYSGLTGPATAGHFHGPAAAGANAGVAIPFANPASPISGTATLTDAQMADLMAGKMYANIHTAANPGGEIRGQMTK
jgi:hypothetical protein